MIGVMPDTLTPVEGVAVDTEMCYRLTKTAADRAKDKLRTKRYDDVAAYMGISRRSFYRLFDGTYPISLNQAAAFSDLIGWPISRAFERVAVRRG